MTTTDVSDNEEFFESEINEEGRLVIDGYLIYRLYDDPDWYWMKADNEEQRGDSRMAKVFRTVAHGLQSEKDAAVARKQRRLSYEQDPTSAFLELSNRVSKLEGEVR